MPEGDGNVTTETEDCPIIVLEVVDKGNFWK